MSLWDVAEIVLDEPEINYTTKKFVEADGIPIMLVKWRCEGLTAEHLAPYQADPTITYAAINEKLTRIELPDDDGCLVRLLKMEMPSIFVSNRSNLTTFYKHTREDGT